MKSRGPIGWGRCDEPQDEASEADEFRQEGLERADYQGLVATFREIVAHLNGKRY